MFFQMSQPGTPLSLMFYSICAVLRLINFLNVLRSRVHLVYFILWFLEKQFLSLYFGVMMALEGQSQQASTLLCHAP